MAQLRNLKGPVPVIALLLSLLFQAAPMRASEPVFVDEWAALGRVLRLYAYGEFVGLGITDEPGNEVFLLDQEEGYQFCALVRQAASRAAQLGPGGSAELGSLKNPSNYLSVYAARTETDPYVMIGIYNTRTEALAAFPLFPPEIPRFESAFARTMVMVGWLSDGSGSAANYSPPTSAATGPAVLEAELEYVYGGELRARGSDGQQWILFYSPSLRVLDTKGHRQSLEELPRGTRLEIQYSELEPGHPNIRAVRLKGP